MKIFSQKFLKTLNKRKVATKRTIAVAVVLFSRNSYTALQTLCILFVLKKKVYIFYKNFS